MSEIGARWYATARSRVADGSARSPAAAWVLVVAAVAILVASPAPAQFSSNQLPQRNSKSTTSIDDSVKNLKSEDAGKRLEAVKSLGASNDPKAVEYLIGALGDPDMRIEAKSVDMLGELRATDATQVLIQHLFLKTTEPQMKQRILAALGKIGDPRAAKPIVEFLQRDLDPATRGTAIYALGDIGSPDALVVLQQITDADKDATARRLAGEAANKVRQRQASVSKEAKGPSETFLPKPPPQQE
jgi:HEAT repeat protein